MHRHIAIMTNAANWPGEEPSKDQRFKDFAEAANDWFWEMDEALRFSYVSKNLSILGLDPVDFIGKTREEIRAGLHDYNQDDDELAALRAHLPYRSVERRSDMARDRWIGSKSRCGITGPV